MAEPFKNLISPPSIARLGAAISAVYPTFAAERFAREAAEGLELLELKARVDHVAGVLRRHLPEAWPAAADVLVASLPPPVPGEGGAGLALWPVLSVVERFGANHPDTSLPVLHAMTSRFSAEFAIRPLLVAHPTSTWAALEIWVDDADEHVRRLVSEGTRPRLPWGLRLQASVADPSRGLALIGRLVDDPSPYVRRSVANHLGDVAKDHPDRAVRVARAWLAENPGRLPLLRHGLRDLLKKGHAGALELFGLRGGQVAVTGLRVEPASASAGGKVDVVATLTAATDGPVRVDVVWAWPAVRGGWAKKTFRGRSRALAAGETWTYRSALSLRPVSTRPLRPGEQQVWLRVCGDDHGPTSFVLAD